MTLEKHSNRALRRGAPGRPTKSMAAGHHRIMSARRPSLASQRGAPTGRAGRVWQAGGPEGRASGTCQRDVPAGRPAGTCEWDMRVGHASGDMPAGTCQRGHPCGVPGRAFRKGSPRESARGMAAKINLAAGYSCHLQAGAVGRPPQPFADGRRTRIELKLLQLAGILGLVNGEPQS